MMLLHGECVKRQVKLCADVRPGLSVMGEKTGLKQVLLNLCLNSLEAMESGGELHVEAARQNGHVALLVRDTGKGVAQRDLKRLFEPFYTTKANGTGLGLSVVQSIVHEHGGQIQVESNLGYGTTIMVHLPIIRNPKISCSS